MQSKRSAPKVVDREQRGLNSVDTYPVVPQLSPRAGVVPVENLRDATLHGQRRKVTAAPRIRGEAWIAVGIDCDNPHSVRA